MSDLTKPRPIIASLAASAAWLGPWILFLLIVGERNNDNAVGYGLFLAMIPVALGLGALAWRIIGAVLRDGPPPLKRFMTRGALLVAGFVLVIQLWSLWSIWDAPPPVRWGEAIFLSLSTVVALGLTALPAAAIWWKLAIRPAVSGR
jgi:hypothetical protein